MNFIGSEREPLLAAQARVSAGPHGGEFAGKQGGGMSVNTKPGSRGGGGGGGSSLDMPPGQDVAVLHGPKLTEWGGKNSSITTLKSFDDVRAVVIANDKAGKETFVRFSKGPEVDAKGGWRSKDYTNGSVHNGISVNNLSVQKDNREIYQTGGKNVTAAHLSEYSFMLAQGLKGTRAYLMTGRISGKDSDGGPLLSDVKPLAFVSETVIKQASQHNKSMNALNEQAKSKLKGLRLNSPEYKAASVEVDRVRKATDWERAGDPVPRVV